MTSSCTFEGASGLHNGGEGLVMIADCISGSKEATKMKKSRRRIYHN